MDEVIRIERRIPVPAPTDEQWGELSIAARIVAPPAEHLAPDPAVLFCFPGGTMTRRYFDLDAEGDRSFSFAEALARRGFVVVLIDHIGVGDSTRPEDGYLLHPQAVAAADAAAIASLKAMLREGLGEYPPLPAFTSIGVGHSMGGMLIGWTQSHHAPFDAVVILGAGPYGLREHLEPAVKDLADDPMATRRELASRLRDAAIPPYIRLGSNAVSRQIFHSGDRRGVAAMRDARDMLIVMCGTFSMIPGSWRPEAASIDVPVLLAFGDQDICRDPSAVPAFFAASPDVQLILLPQTGHSHFVFPSREMLFRRVGDWVADIAGRRSGASGGAGTALIGSAVADR